MDFTKLSINDLKAMKCDIYEQTQNAQIYLQAINQELEKRAKESQEVKEETKEVKSEV